MFLAAFGLARSVGNDALGFRLADTLAGVGFHRFHRGERPFFSAFLRHFFTPTSPTARTPGPSFVSMADTSRPPARMARGVVRLSYKTASTDDAMMKYF